MNPFQILGLNNNATREEITQAYRRLAQRHHPDKGGNVEDFARIRAAYQMALKPRRCPECLGRGQVRSKVGPFTKLVPCPSCWR